MNCSTCKHWRKIRNDDHRSKTGILFPGPYGECMLITEYPDDAKDVWIHGTHILDDLSLITKPNFYCKHYNGE